MNKRLNARNPEALGSWHLNASSCYTAQQVHHEVENDGKALRIAGCLEHDRRHGRDEDRLPHALGAVAANVGSDLAATGGVADQRRVFEVERLDDRCEIVGIRFFKKSDRKEGLTRPIQADETMKLTDDDMKAIEDFTKRVRGVYEIITEPQSETRPSWMKHGHGWIDHVHIQFGSETIYIRQGSVSPIIWHALHYPNGSLERISPGRSVSEALAGISTID